jgi:hypothetical protein
MLTFDICFVEEHKKYMLYCATTFKHLNISKTHYNITTIIGYYDTFLEASLAYKHKLRSIFGEIENDIGLYKSSDEPLKLKI